MTRQCETCDKTNETWELRCTSCALSSDIPDDWPILIVGPSLAYRIVAGVKLATPFTFVGALVFLAAVRLNEFAPQILTGTILIIVQLIIMIARIVAAVMCISSIYVAFSQIVNNHAIFSISKTKIKFGDHVDLYDSIEDDVPRETKFIDAETKLTDVRRFHVTQGWFANQLGQGDVEIFTDESAKPKVIIPGVTRPFIFKEKLDLILRYLNTFVTGPKPAQESASQETGRLGE